MTIADNNVAYLREGKKIYPPSSSPMSVARKIVKDIYTDDSGHRTIAYWCGDWYRYNGHYWQRTSANDGDLPIKGDLWTLLDGALTQDSKGNEVPWSPTKSKIEGVIEPLKIISKISGDVEAPALISSGKSMPGSIVMNNGVLRLGRNGEGELTEINPDLFTTWGLDFDYNPSATCPNWKKFLDDIFAHDRKAADLLQEFIGYIISGRTDLQKQLIVIGPPRAGKGVIQRVVTRLIGGDNVISPTYGDLSNDFGLHMMIGKPLAIIADSRDTAKRSDMPLEKVLKIVGEDQMSVNRKNKDYWQGKLPTRFMIFSNRLPSFSDNQGAFVARTMSFELKKSFLGKEDRGLEGRLAKETEGIFKWALEGLRRLDANGGKFTIPDTMGDTNDMLMDITSPMSVFIDECLTVTENDDDVATIKQVHGVYRRWCNDGGKTPLAQIQFMSELKSMGISCRNTSIGGDNKCRRVFGVKVKDNQFSTQSL